MEFDVSAAPIISPTFRIVFWGILGAFMVIGIAPWILLAMDLGGH